jgi:hypothetical protein
MDVWLDIIIKNGVNNPALLSGLSALYFLVPGFDGAITK